MIDKYILKGKTAVPCPDSREWALWFEKADRVVKKEYVGEVFVSTVFIGLDHGCGSGQLQIFETMVFPNYPRDMLENYCLENYCRRCATWQEAEAQHEAAVQWVKDGMKTDADESDGMKTDADESDIAWNIEIKGEKRERAMNATR